MILNAKGFSPTNLRYMMRFYGLYKDIEIVPQLGERFEMASRKVFMIPWEYIKLLIDKCHDNLEKFDFYVDKVIENNWSRAVLLNFLDMDLYERYCKLTKSFCREAWQTRKGKFKVVISTIPVGRGMVK